VHQLLGEESLRYLLETRDLDMAAFDRATL